MKTYEKPRLASAPCPLPLTQTLQIVPGTETKTPQNNGHTRVTVDAIGIDGNEQVLFKDVLKSEVEFRNYTSLLLTKFGVPEKLLPHIIQSFYFHEYDKSKRMYTLDAFVEDELANIGR